MSNLAHGSIRLRGKRQDIIRFLENELRTRKEKIILVSKYAANVERTELPVTVKMSNHGRSLTISRDSDTVRGFYFATDDSGQFLHVFDSSPSFKAQWAREESNPESDDVLFLDLFSVRYEVVDSKWFMRKAKEYEIDIRIFLTDFESGVFDDAVWCYTFKRTESEECVVKTNRSDAIWSYWDKIPPKSFKSTHEKHRL